MQLHTLQPKTKQKKGKYVGRGGKRGTTSGKGTKGQKARSGHKIRPEIRDLIKRIPKLRGRGKHSNIGIPKTLIFAVNVGVIGNAFQPGEIVTKDLLVKKSIISPKKGKPFKVKVLGDESCQKNSPSRDFCFRALRSIQ